MKSIDSEPTDLVILSSQQTNIFSDDQHQLYFAELCNALYERELHTLSEQKINNVSLLQRKIGGLKHHVKRAAEQLLSNNGPLQIDVHNGSWQSKQAVNCMATKFDSAKTLPWYQQYARMGLCVPVHVNELAAEHLELDSIDRIDLQNERLHLNKFGWFRLDGEFSESQTTDIQQAQKRLLKPTKANMSAACCGHTWNYKGRTQPRTLSLRELLLSNTINWLTFR
ncbi:MAG: hypothetical protein ACI88A_003535 [Paraglaciecola sp.]|jgi:hypothetical protein